MVLLFDKQKLKRKVKLEYITWNTLLKDNFYIKYKKKRKQKIKEIIDNR